MLPNETAENNTTGDNPARFTNDINNPSAISGTQIKVQQAKNNNDSFTDIMQASELKNQKSV